MDGTSRHYAADNIAVENLTTKFSNGLLRLAAGLVLICTTFQVQSDQNDPRLTELFAQLHQVKEQEAANQLTDDIWAIWRDSGDPHINQLMKRGIAAMQSGHLRESVAIFDQIIRLAPDFAEGWNKRATVYFFLRDYEKSAADVRKTLLLEPRHFGATAGLGLIFLSLDYYQSALEAFEKALDINPHLVGPKMQIEQIRAILKDEPA